MQRRNRANCMVKTIFTQNNCGMTFIFCMYLYSTMILVYYYLLDKGSRFGGTPTTTLRLSSFAKNPYVALSIQAFRPSCLFSIPCVLSGLMIDFYVLVGSMACVVPRICGFLVFRSFVQKCVLLALAIDFCGSIYTVQLVLQGL